MPILSSGNNPSFRILLAALLFWGAAAAALPSFEQTKASLVSSESQLFDREGTVIQEIRTNLRLRQLGWVPLGDVSRAMKDAILLSEDHRFYSHHGMDWWALASALAGRLVGRSGRGASTLSMQVAAFIEPSLRPKRLRRDWLQKIFQIRAALELERTWSKNEILEAYLNLVSFRGELQGVGAAFSFGHRRPIRPGS
jgi:penicillin-binding protein 1C